MEFKNFDEFNDWMDSAIEGMDYSLQRLDDAHDIFWHAVNWNLPIFIWTDARPHLNGYYVPDDLLLNDEVWEDQTLIVDSVRITPNLNLDEARRFGPYSMTICFRESWTNNRKDTVRLLQCITCKYNPEACECDESDEDIDGMCVFWEKEE